jgi:hypothetical protein
MDFHLDALLNLPNITVFSYASELDFIILNLQLISDGIDCPNCHNYTDTLHQVRPILSQRFIDFWSISISKSAASSILLFSLSKITH